MMKVFIVDWLGYSRHIHYWFVEFVCQKFYTKHSLLLLETLNAYQETSDIIIWTSPKQIVYGYTDCKAKLFSLMWNSYVQSKSFTLLC